MTTTNEPPAVRNRRRRPAAGRNPAAPAVGRPADNGPEIAVNGLFDVVSRQTVIRVAGYLPGPRDVTVPAALAAGLRRGDLIAGTARENANGATLTRIESINLQSPAEAL